MGKERAHGWRKGPAMWFWIIAGILVLLLVVGAWLWDRRHGTSGSTIGDRPPNVTSPYDLGDGGFSL